MSRDTQRSIVPMAPSILSSPDSPKLREFRVPFIIEGVREVFAEDLESAQRLVEACGCGDKIEWAEYGELETFPPEPVQ
jgi:hypothetical protein